MVDDQLKKLCCGRIVLHRMLHLSTVRGKISSTVLERSLKVVMQSVYPRQWFVSKSDGRTKSQISQTVSLHRLRVCTLKVLIGHSNTILLK